MAATMQGSTDTTLFVLTVYFGAVGIKKTRYALAVGLLADAAGILTAIFICNLVFG
jgi:spore maturation protein B